MVAAAIGISIVCIIIIKVMCKEDQAETVKGKGKSRDKLYLM